MLRRSLVAIVIALLIAPAGFAGTPGMFGGKVVQGLAKNPPGKWIYIKGRAGIRRVEISKAHFDYASSVPRGSRATIAADDLKDGTLVQVAAEQDSAGEWIAQSILILRLADQDVVRSAAPRTSSAQDFFIARNSSNAARNRSMSAFNR
jgi:hypothetical protein